MKVNLYKLGCFYDRSLSGEDALDNFALDIIEVCKKHGVTIEGVNYISPSIDKENTWDIRGLMIKKLKKEP